MIAKFKRWIRHHKTKFAIKHIGTLGLVAVRIETKAGSDYLHCPDGTFRKIGRDKLAKADAEAAGLRIVK